MFYCIFRTTARPSFLLGSATSVWGNIWKQITFIPRAVPCATPAFVSRNTCHQVGWECTGGPNGSALWYTCPGGGGAPLCVYLGDPDTVPTTCTRYFITIHFSLDNTLIRNYLYFCLYPIYWTLNGKSLQTPRMRLVDTRTQMYHNNKHMKLIRTLIK